jgi:hypothetical protein
MSLAGVQRTRIWDAGLQHTWRAAVLATLRHCHTAGTAVKDGSACSASGGYHNHIGLRR